MEHTQYGNKKEKGKKRWLWIIGILAIIMIGGYIMVVKPIQETLFESEEKDLIEGQLELSGGEEYYKIISFNSNGEAKIRLSNPTSSFLDYETLSNSIVVRGTNPLKFNVSEVEGAVERINIYEIRNITKKIYEKIPNGSYWRNVDNLAPWGEEEVTYFNQFGDNKTNNKSYFLEVDYDNSRLRISNYTLVNTKNITVEEEFPITIRMINLSAFENKTYRVEIKPKIGIRAGGSWGYALGWNPWYNVSFNKRINITFDTSWATEDFINFPVLVRLNSTRINYSLTNDDGSDLRFVDDDESTILDHEIELWNESGDSFVWVRVPQINGGSTTDFIQLYYNNNTNVADGQNVEGVWFNDYVLVQHLGEDPSDTAPQFIDSTYSSLDGSSNGMTSANRLRGFIGNAIDFDGVDDSIDFGTGATVNNLGNITIELWANWDTHTTADNDQRWVAKTDDTVGWYFAPIHNDPDANNVDETVWSRIIDNEIKENINYLDQNNIMPLDQWHFAAWKYEFRNETDNVNFSVNETTYPALGNDTASQRDDSGCGILFGNNYVQGTSCTNSDDGEDYSGLLDEVRISNVTRSDEWINATYHSTKDAMNTYGTEESSPDDPPVWSNNQTNSTVAGSLVNHSVFWEDEVVALSGYIFEWHNGSNWTLIAESADEESGTAGTIGAFNSGGFGGYAINWSSSHITGTASTPANANGATDDTFTTDTLDASWTSRWAMEDPTSSITGTQNITIRVRPADAGAQGDPTVVVTLYEDGSSVQTIIPSTEVLNDAGTVNLSGTFDASVITNPNNVEIQVAVTGTGGGPNRNTIQLDSIRWNVSLEAAGSGDVDANKTGKEYMDIGISPYKKIDNITLTVEVSNYNTSASTTNSNTNPQLWAGIWNGSEYFNLGTFGVSGTGNFSLTTTDSAVMTAWQTPSNRDINLSGYFIDGDEGELDAINWTGVWVEIGGEQELRNDSFVIMTGTANNSDVLKWINTTVGSTIKWRVHANDSINQWNTTDLFEYTTTADTPAGDTCTYTSGDWNVDCSDNCEVNTTLNLGNNNINLEGVGNFYIYADILNVDEIRKDNSCTVHKQDGVEIT